jgi:hypothetical protein
MFVFKNRTINRKGEKVKNNRKGEKVKKQENGPRSN